MVTTVVGYVRVSTEEQAASGLSIEAQRERIRAYCVARGWELADVIVDAGESAKNLNRPGMRVIKRLMSERLIDGIVALKLDRLTRSVRDLHELLALSESSKVALVSVTENMDTGSAAGRLMINVLAAMAEWEREIIAERTVAALKVKKDRGERVSFHVATGSTEGARGLEEREALAFIRDRLATLIATGERMSFRRMSAELAGRGLLNRAGAPYHASAVSRMIKRIVEENPDLRTAMDREEIDGRRDRLAAVIAEARRAA